MACWQRCGKRTARNTSAVVMPREKRGIQYAAALRFNRRRWWNTGSPAFAGDGTGNPDLLAGKRWQ
jgi:hypothetical protein